MCSMLTMKRAYILVQVALLISMYAIPYLLLANVRGISLFMFWTIVTLLVSILGIVWLRVLQEKFEG